MENAILIACFIAVVVAIVVNFTVKVNLGIVSMAFAFIIGCLMAGLSASKVFGFWPDSLIFFLLASSLFYGFARENGTLTLFGSKILYKFRSGITFLPWIFALIAFILGILGAGPGTIVLLAPIGYAVAAQVGMSPILMVFAIDCGYNCGTQNPWTGTGVVMYGLVETNLDGNTALAFSTYLRSYALFIISKVILLLIFHLFFVYLDRKKKVEGAKNVVIMDKEPEPFSPVQKRTLALILVSFLLLVIPNIVNTLAPVDNAGFKAFVALCKPQAILIIFAVIASFMNIGDPKKVINKLPMGTVLTIAGVAFLMEIAKANGLIETVTGLFSTGLPTYLAAPLFAFLASFLSIFASGTSVVLPLMFPMVPALAAATGLNTVAFYAAAQLGALATPISPFSTAGAQFVALAPNDLQDGLVKQQFCVALVMMVLNTLLTLLGFCYILKV